MKYVAFLDILGFKNTLKTLGQERSIEYIENYSRIVYQVFSRYNRNEERQNTEKKINGFVVSDSVVLYTNDAMKESLSDLLNIIVDLCREEFGRNSIQQIMKQTGLKRASVHAYLPYSKGSYNLSEVHSERWRNILQPEREKCNTGNSDESVYESTTNSEGRGLCKWLKEAGNVWCKLSVSDLSSDWRVFKEPLTDKPCGQNSRSSHGYF